ncbi:MAG: hypothetical protein JKY03_04260 [Aureispira sp.]|nr:hypothetical protein [Aureispira sp.]
MKKKFKSHMDFVGMTHNFYVDYILSEFLKSNNQNQGNSGVSWFGQWSKLVFYQPIPPFNPRLLKSLSGNDGLFENVDMLDKQSASQYGELIQFVRENKDIDLEDIKGINKVFDKNELKIFEELKDITQSFNNSTLKQIDKLEEKAFEASSKENIALVLAVFSVAKSSAVYWNRDIFNKVWYREMFGDAQDVFASEGGGGSTTWADVKGAIVGGFWGAVFGGVGGGIGGGIGGSLIASCDQAAANKEAEEKEAKDKE